VNDDALMAVGDIISLDVSGEQRWRVVAITPRGWQLQPVHPDGSLDGFNAAVGEYWIERVPKAEGVVQ
jgi:hypothetical protein